MMQTVDSGGEEHATDLNEASLGRRNLHAASQLALLADHTQRTLPAREYLTDVVISVRQISKNRLAIGRNAALAFRSTSIWIGLRILTACSRALQIPSRSSHHPVRSR